MRPQGQQQFVVDMTQLVGALISVHDALALVMNLDSLPDPPCSSVRLTGDDPPPKKKEKNRGHSLGLNSTLHNVTNK